MKYGLLIGTCGSAPYIHLWLESRKRFFPNVPAMVHEDFSSETQLLGQLCERYEVGFAHTDKNYGHWNGDMQGIIRGFEWSRRRNLDVLVKMSRRFIPVHNWTNHMQWIADRPQCAVFSNSADESGLPIRTECIAFRVEPWCTHGCVATMRNIVDEHRQQMCVEVEIATMAKGIHRYTTGRTEHRFIKSNYARHFNRWSFVPIGRATIIPGVLWHPYSTPEDYAKTAREFDLPYLAKDFTCGKLT